MNDSKVERPLANNHISVDCVVLGFDGEQLRVLLAKRTGSEGGTEYHDMKLPGSLIYEDENFDDAASRVLYELTGMKKVELVQFKTFGSKDRTADPKDVHWLEQSTNTRIRRIVTVAYLALVKISHALNSDLQGYEVCWMALKDVPTLAFDHNVIIAEAMTYIRQYATFNPSMLFDLLPRKFTAAQLRVLCQLVEGREIDVRNFHKRISQMKYVVALDEREQGVAHRAARYYKFDRKIYNKTRI